MNHFKPEYTPLIELMLGFERDWGRMPTAAEFRLMVEADTALAIDEACRCPDDRCVGYHHGVGEPCGCTEVPDAGV